MFRRLHIASWTEAEASRLRIVIDRSPTVRVAFPLLSEGTVTFARADGVWTLGQLIGTIVEGCRASGHPGDLWLEDIEREPDGLWIARLTAAKEDHQ